MKILFFLCFMVLFVLSTAIVGCQQQPSPATIPAPSSTVTLPPTKSPEAAPAPTPPPPKPPEPTQAPVTPPPKPSEPEIKPAPEPVKPKEQPTAKTPEEILRNLSYDVPDVYRAALQLYDKYPIKDSKPLLEAIGEKDNPYYGFLVSELRFGGWFSFIKADYVDGAIQHITNANSLIVNKRLPNEASPHDVSEVEISSELASALSSLEKQVFYTIIHQTNNVNWAQSSDNPKKLSDTETKQLIEVYDAYRSEISNVTTKLEFILSYCPEPTSK